jgi:single-strand DNA-binding protein
MEDIQMASLNQCNFIGRVGKEPEIKYTGSGQAVANLSLACGEKFKNKSGEWEEKTEWVNVVFWGKLAEIVGEYVEKGRELFVSGRMTTRKWQDKDGKDRYSTEIVAEKMQMIGGKGDGQKAKPQQDSGSYEEPTFDADMDIPF